MFCDSGYDTDKDTRKSVRSLVATLGEKLLTCSSKTKRTVTLIITDADYIDLSACTQEVKLASMLIESMNKVKNTSVIYEDNQVRILLANNRQVGICTKQINVRHHFLRDILKIRILIYSILRLKITLHKSLLGTLRKQIL